MSGSYSEVVQLANGIANIGTVAISSSWTLPAGTNVIGGFTLRDASNQSQAATVTAFHNTDNQFISNSGNGVLTGGVNQLINTNGNLDRARETFADGIPSVGIATGTQQTHQPYATTLAQAVSASASAQTVTLAAVSFTARASTVTIAPGSSLLIDTGTNQETVFVTAVNTAAKTVTAVFSKAHSSGVAVSGSAYNQAKDATLGDGVGGAGLAASVTYIWDNVGATFSIERAATSDALPGAAVLGESTVLWNGSTFDRLRAVSGDAMAATGIEASVDMLWNGSGYDRPRSAVSDGLATTGVPGEALLVWNGTTFDRATGSASRGTDVNIKRVGNLSYTVCTTGTVGAATGTLTNAGTLTGSLTITSPVSSTANVWLNPTGGSAVVGAGHLVAAGGGSFTYGGPGVPLPSGNITAISDNGTVVVALAGG